MGHNRHTSTDGKMNNGDPLAWLSQTLTRIANRWPAADIELLCHGTSNLTPSANRLQPIQHLPTKNPLNP